MICWDERLLAGSKKSMFAHKKENVIATRHRACMVTVVIAHCGFEMADGVVDF